MLDGMCVKTMVLTRPILSAILAAARNEKAVRTPAIEKMYDKVVKLRPNLVKNQKATMLRLTKPPPNESKENNPDNLPTIFFVPGDSTCVNGFAIWSPVSSIFFDNMK